VEDASKGRKTVIEHSRRTADCVSSLAHTPALAEAVTNCCIELKIIRNGERIDREPAVRYECSAVVCSASLLFFVAFLCHRF